MEDNEFAQEVFQHLEQGEFLMPTDTLPPWRRSLKLVLPHREKPSSPNPGVCRQCGKTVKWRSVHHDRCWRCEIQFVSDRDAYFTSRRDDE